MARERYFTGSRFEERGGYARGVRDGDGDAKGGCDGDSVADGKHWSRAVTACCRLCLSFPSSPSKEDRRRATQAIARPASMQTAVEIGLLSKRRRSARSRPPGEEARSHKKADLRVGIG